ncbi:MAG: hypothetical protein K2O61_03060 [Bacteroidaceae bacterium]|nr:hypothetical protein [Bacteroidaceae bacterium]
MRDIKFALAAVACAVASASMAQNLHSSYFTEGHLYRHTLNPAFGNDQTYISMPAFGNVNVHFNTNLPMDNIFYNVNGRTALFLNPHVNTGEFLSGINDKNKISESLKMQILGVGFKGFGGYNTIEINARQSLDVNLPGDLFRMAKEGLENKTYDMGGLSVNANAYAEMALGHSRQINDQLRVGAKLKFLFGFANVDAEVNTARLTLREDAWIGETDAKIQASIKGLKYETEEKLRGPEGEQSVHQYVNDIDIDGVGMNGFGLAMDLGAEYKLDNNWSFSAALLDLGFINWSNNCVAATNGLQQVRTDKYLFSVDDDAKNSFDNELDRLTDDLATLYELKDQGDTGSRSKALAATMNLGVQYTPDFYNKLTFGLMNSTRMAGSYSCTDFRLSANVAPIKSVSATANFSVGTFGSAFGWVLDFHPNAFNFFIGMDRPIGKLAKQGVPLSKGASLSLGMNVAFGRK